MYNWFCLYVFESVAIWLRYSSWKICSKPKSSGVLHESWSSMNPCRYSWVVYTSYVKGLALDKTAQYIQNGTSRHTNTHLLSTTNWRSNQVGISSSDIWCSCFKTTTGFYHKKGEIQNKNRNTPAYFYYCIQWSLKNQESYFSGLIAACKNVCFYQKNPHSTHPAHSSPIHIP